MGVWGEGGVVVCDRRRSKSVRASLIITTITPRLGCVLVEEEEL